MSSTQQLPTSKSSEQPGDLATVCLVRYGAMPQVGRFTAPPRLIAPDTTSLVGHSVVVTTERGIELGQLLSILPKGAGEEHAMTGEIQRIATADDISTSQRQRTECDGEFETWLDRIKDWNVQLQLLDIEKTLEGDQVILYVLNDQDAETTRLALLTAAAGYGIVHVQPVTAEGVTPIGKPSSGGGCGSGGGGCGSGGCGSK